MHLRFQFCDVSKLIQIHKYLHKLSTSFATYGCVLFYKTIPACCLLFKNLKFLQYEYLKLKRLGSNKKLRLIKIQKFENIYNRYPQVGPTSVDTRYAVSEYYEYSLKRVRKIQLWLPVDC